MAAFDLGALLANLIYYAFDVAYTTMSLDLEVSKVLSLDDKLSKEQAVALKKEMGMTDTAINTLRRVKTNWQGMMKDIETISPYIFGKVREDAYDWSVAMTNELIAVIALYLVQTDNDDETTHTILRTMVDCKPLDADVAKFVQGYFSKAGQARKRIFDKAKDNGQEN